jgi:anti-sigma factor RsiW
MHPQQTELALYAGGELAWWRRRRLSRHLRQCESCRAQVESFRGWRAWLRQQDELPAEVNWSRLAAEMRANIRLGLAAGECVASARPASVRWRPAALALPVLLLLLAGWVLQIWHPPVRRPAAPRGPVVAATAAGVELRQGGVVLTLLHPHASDVGRFASGEGVRVRYVDAETGMVTISHVYAE